MKSACCFFSGERSGMFTNFAPLLEVNKQNKSRPKTLSLDQIFVQRHTYELNPSSTEVLAFVIKLLPTNPKFSRCFERKSLVWDVELLRQRLLADPAFHQLCQLMDFVRSNIFN
jgi:hypothetical protein